ncbi:unnamed protein product [Phyllotreta striolata]|uniref:DALR anticodon binding domain-containing protein n=1 Tax=Phyllotreta striolata TaxID=444603 RepID=A0A9N9TIX4_PHYSR|nr:unnamed protein product [Phyllotreta striolata]
MPDVLEEFISNIQEFLTGPNCVQHNLIRRHTKKLNELGDVSFPLNINNWYQYIDSTAGSKSDVSSIIHYNHPHSDDEVAKRLIEDSSKWTIEVKEVIYRNNDAHVFIKRSSNLYRAVIKQVLDLNDKFGSSDLFKNNVKLKIIPDVDESNTQQLDLSTLRIILLKDIATNFIQLTTSDNTEGESLIYLVKNSIDNSKCILCGPVINEKGTKSSYTTSELYLKRSSDMRMMAQHKYGVQIKPNSSWETYFEKLGRASVTVEMLTNKPQKSIKISPHDLQSANKGPSFIFYNCARLAALFKEFNKRVERNEYPDLPKIDNMDFSLLNQPEEWELFYVYILQYPTVINSCIKDIEKEIFNPQYLISFLSNLCSVFSVYYRRVRILTNPKEHMFSIIHARIYLLKALQCVFHNSLRLLNIEPVKEM